MGGAAPGLPGPEALLEEWSSSSSEESPVYATKPVFTLFTAGSVRMTNTNRRERKEEERERGGEREENQKQQQQHFFQKGKR